MLPFDLLWRGHFERKHRSRGDAGLRRTYRVDYQAGAEAGWINLCTAARPTAGLATEAQAVLQARGLEATIRRIVPVTTEHGRP